MAYKRFMPSMSPDKDAGWGLIFRLNSLWAKVDIPAEAGDYDTWNTLLDRVFCNLLYRNPLEIQRDPLDPAGKRIVDIKLKEDAYEIYVFISKKIFKAKIDYNKAIKDIHTSQTQRIILKSRWYQSVILKDIWLRKYMQELGLYLKEVERSPGTALFGGAA